MGFNSAFKGLNMNADLVGLLDIPAPYAYPFQRKIPLRAHHEYIYKYIYT